MDDYLNNEAGTDRQQASGDSQSSEEFKAGDKVRIDIYCGVDTIWQQVGVVLESQKTRKGHHRAIVEIVGPLDDENESLIYDSNDDWIGCLFLARRFASGELEVTGPADFRTFKLALEADLVWYSRKRKHRRLRQWVEKSIRNGTA